VPAKRPRSPRLRVGDPQLREGAFTVPVRIVTGLATGPGALLDVRYRGMVDTEVPEPAIPRPAGFGSRSQDVRRHYRAADARSSERASNGPGV
jgi:hypothetical protein